MQLMKPIKDYYDSVDKLNKAIYAIFETLDFKSKSPKRDIWLLYVLSSRILRGESEILTPELYQAYKENFE